MSFHVTEIDVAEHKRHNRWGGRHFYSRGSCAIAAVAFH